MSIKAIQINVGHPVYSGCNAFRRCASIGEAIRVLRDRGAKRDDARRAIKEARAGSFVTVRTGRYGDDVTEVTLPRE